MEQVQATQMQYVGYKREISSSSIASFRFVAGVSLFFASFGLIDGVISQKWWEIVLGIWLVDGARALFLLSRIAKSQYLISSVSIACKSYDQSTNITWTSVRLVRSTSILMLPAVRAFRLYHIVNDEGDQILVMPYMLRTDRATVSALVAKLESFV